MFCLLFIPCLILLPNKIHETYQLHMLRREGYATTAGLDKIYRHKHQSWLAFYLPSYASIVSFFSNLHNRTCGLEPWSKPWKFSTFSGVYENLLILCALSCSDDIRAIVCVWLWACDKLSENNVHKEVWTDVSVCVKNWVKHTHSRS